MPTVYGFGSTLVTERRLDALKPGELATLASRAGPVAGELSLAAEAQPFQPIGIGKPMSVEIAYVYTGGLSAPSFFGNRPDMLIASAVKRLPVFEAAPRAINCLFRKVAQSFRFCDIAAAEPGTPLIYHTPALSDRGTTLTIEFVFDHFPEEAITQVSSLLSSAAGIPVFAPATGYLMAGGCW